VTACAGALWHKGIAGLRGAVGFVLVAQRAVDAFVMSDIWPIGGIAIMAGVGMTGGAEIGVVVIVRWIEAGVTGPRAEGNRSPVDNCAYGEKIGRAMRIVAGIAWHDKVRLRRCAVAFVAMSADILASFIRIGMAAGAEVVRFSPQAGIII